ncbi:MAG: thermonuclease family protein [Thermoleophilia bacterium]
MTTRLPRLACALVLTAAAATGCAGGGASDEPPATGDGEAGRVVRVVDGDTVIVALGAADERVRLLGVDAPESATPDRPVECYGPQSAAEAARLMPDGARVTLRFDPTQGRRDRFDRLLAEVTTATGTSTVNEQLVAGGFAEVFRGDGRGRLQPALRAAEREARDAVLGLWGACR